MAANPSPLGCNHNQPAIDAGTNCLGESVPPVPAEGVIRAAPISPLESAWNRTTDWFSEFGEAVEMLTWWGIGSPAMGFPNGDLEFGPGDKETEHIRNTAAYIEAVEIYQDWLNHGQPSGEFVINGTPCQFVPQKGYFYVKGRTGAGRGPRGHFTEPLEHPLWGYTGDFAIRFTETGFPTEGYVRVEIENYTSLPSFFHGVSEHFLENLYVKRSGVPLLSRSRQVYRFDTYIARNPAPSQITASATDTTHVVVTGDSLSAIAKTYYNDMDLWPILFARNHDIIGSDPDKIKVGQSLAVPSQEKLTPDQIKQAKEQARLARMKPVKLEPLR
jgi:hypothetical protein